ncbi:MAG: hypothetical protein ACE14S_11105 [Candidatus Bathyarchaeia archaeon]
MTCYFRHLNAVFDKAGIAVTKENRKQLDQVIQDIVGTDGKDCSETWRELKKRLVQDETEFVEKLKRASDRLQSLEKGR